MNFDDILNKMQDLENKKNNPGLQPSPNDTPRIRAIKQRMAEKQEARKKKNEKQAELDNIYDSYTSDKPKPMSGEDYLLGGGAANEDAMIADRTGAATIGRNASEGSTYGADNQASEFNVDSIHMAATSKFSENFMVGLGNMIGDYGDIAQFVGSAFPGIDMDKGNILSRYLQEVGGDIADRNATYIPPELMDPEFKFSTIFNPDFWLTHGAQFAPQIIEILGTVAVSGGTASIAKAGMKKALTRTFSKELAELGVKKGAKRSGNAALRSLAREAGEEAVESTGELAAKSGLRSATVNTTGRAGSGSVVETAGTGRGLGKLMTTQGELSQLGNKIGNATAGITGGVLTNMRVSLANAGEVYNTYADMKDQDGNPMFSKEELAQMASQTALNNMSYMMYDILSWSLTFGNAKGAIADTFGKIKKQAYSKAAQNKITGALVAKAVHPAMKKGLQMIQSAAQTAGKASKATAGVQRLAATQLAEGFEETIQEVHEEWSKMKAHEEIAGSLVNYEGPGKEYTDSFFDFYTSKEMEGTRTIAAAMGAAAGGLFNIRQLVDKAAEDGHKLNTRAELFKRSLKNGRKEDYVLQQEQVDATVSELIFQGQDAFVEPFIQHSLEKGIIDEERAKSLRDLTTVAVANREKTNALNMSGKHAYFTSVMAEEKRGVDIDNEKRSFANQKTEIENAFGIYSEPDESIDADPEEGLTETESFLKSTGEVMTREEFYSDPLREGMDYDSYVQSMEKLVNQSAASIFTLEEQLNYARENQRNLLAGKPAGPIRLDSKVDKTGATFYYNNETDDDSETEIDDEKPKVADDSDPHVAKTNEYIKKGKEKIKAAAEKASKNPIVKKAISKSKKIYGKVKDGIDRYTESREAIEADNLEKSGVTPADYKKSDKKIEEMSRSEMAARRDEIDAEIAAFRAGESTRTVDEDNQRKVAINQLRKERQNINKAIIDNDPSGVLKKAQKKYSKMTPEQRKKAEDDLWKENNKINRKIENGTATEKDNERSAQISEEMEILYALNQAAEPVVEYPKAEKKLSEMTEEELDDRQELLENEIDRISQLPVSQGRTDALEAIDAELNEIDAIINGEEDSDTETETESETEEETEEEGLTDDDLDEYEASLSKSSKKKKNPKRKESEQPGISDVFERRKRKKGKTISKKAKKAIAPKPKGPKPIVMDGSDDVEVKAPKTAEERIDAAAKATTDAIAGGKSRFKTLMSKGRAFGSKMMKNSGYHTNMLRYRQMINKADRYSTSFLIKEDVINNSGMWNGKERPNVYFIHSLETLDSKYSEENEAESDYVVPGAYLRVANVIFMRQDLNPNEEELTFHHEFLHFNYGWGENTSEMKEYLQKMMEQFPDLYDAIARTYDDRKLLSVPRHVAENWSKARMKEEQKKLRDAMEDSITPDEVATIVKKVTGFPLLRYYSDLKTDEQRAAYENEIDKLFASRIQEAMNNDSVQIYKGELMSVYTDNEGKSSFTDELYAHMADQGIIHEYPPMEQPIIREEFFVATQEGRRSQKYNIYFDEKSPNPPARTSYWRKVVDRLKRAYQGREAAENAVIEMLDNEDLNQFTDINSAAFNNFTKRFPPGSLDYDLRERRTDNIKQKYAEEAADLEAEIDSTIIRSKTTPKIVSQSAPGAETNQEGYAEPSNVMTDEESERALENADSDDEISLETREDEDDNIINESFFSEGNKDLAHRKTWNLIKKFTSQINKRLEERALEKMRKSANKNVYIPTRLFNEQALGQEMFDLAKESTDAVDFILQMRYSENPDTKLFMKNLQSTADGRAAEVELLKTYYFLNKSMHNTAPIITTINQDGRIVIEDAKTSMMRSRRQGMMKRLEADASSSRAIRRSSGGDSKRFLDFVDDMETIRNTEINDIKDSTIRRVLEFFGDKSVDYNRIIERGNFIIKGQPHSIRAILKDIATKSVERAYVNKNGRYVKFDPETMGIFDSENNIYDIYGYRPRRDDIDRSKGSRDQRAKTAGPAPLNNFYDGMVEAILTTDARFKDSKSYRDANGNLTRARSINNTLLATVESMNNDILNNLDLSKKNARSKFIAKYAHVAGVFYDKESKKENRGKYGNRWLGHIFDTVKATGIPYEINIGLGVRVDKDGNSKTMKQMSPDEDSYQQLMLYASNMNKKSFVMDLGRFAGSNTQYMASMPIVKDNFKFSKGKYILRNTPENQAAYNIYKQQSESDLTFNEYAEALANMVDGEIAYWENQRLEMDSQIRDNNPILKSNSDVLTPLTEQQKSEIASFFYNTSLNGIYFNEVIFPSLKFAKNELVKRAALGSTTFTPLGSNVQNEVIYFNRFKRDINNQLILDEKGNPIEDKLATDGAAYILEEDLERIKAATGNSMNVNGHVKMAHVGVEREGPQGMSGKTQYDKPLYVALNEAIVRQNPGLRNLYELMKRRKEKYRQEHIARHGKEPSLDYATGSPNHIVTAVSIHSEKTKNDVKKDWTIDMDDDIERGVSESLESSENMLDSIYYDRGEFTGFSGENIGIQLQFNDGLRNTGLPSQFLSYITTGGIDSDNFSELVRAQELIYSDAQKRISEFKEVVRTGTADDIIEFVRDNDLIDREHVDHVVKMILEDGNYNLAIPQARELILNTLTQYIKQHGNRVSTPGTQARVIPSSSFRKKFTIDGLDYEIEEMHQSAGFSGEGEALRVNQSVDSRLKGYKEFSHIENGTLVKRYEPGEMVAPANLMSIGVKSRAYYVAWNGDTSQNGTAYRKAKEEAKRRFDSGNIESSEVKRFRFKDSTGNTLYGFYVPGDTVMGTRIPSHGPQSTAFFEVVDFDVSGSSQTMVNDQFTEVSGQDYDGDALFINVKDKSKRGFDRGWNEAFDIIKEHWLRPDVQENLINEKLDFDTRADEAISVLGEKYPDKILSDDVASLKHLYTPEGRREQFQNTLISKNNIGASMSLHRTYSILSNYNVQFREPIEIGAPGMESYYFKEGFNDETDENGSSRVIRSANMANLILDDIKEGYASKLGINNLTIKYAMPLLNMGVSLTDVAIILNSDLIKKWSLMNSSNDNMFTDNGYLNKNINNNQTKMELLGEQLSLKKGIPAVIDINNIDSDSSKLGLINLISQLSEIQNDMHNINKIIAGHNKMESNGFIGIDELTKFDDLLNNTGESRNSFLQMNDDFVNSPLIQNYRANAQLLVDLSTKTDIAFSNNNKVIWDNLINGNPRNISDEKQRKLHNSMQRFTVAQYLGLGGREIKQHAKNLTTPGSDENIFDRLSKYMSRPVNPDEEVDMDTVVYGDTILFKNGIRTNLYGKEEMKEISLNGVVSSEETSDAMMKAMKEEFSMMPPELKRDLAIYDLMKTGFAGRKSLFPLFDEDLKAEIQIALDMALEDNVNNINSTESREFIQNFIGNNMREYTVELKNAISIDSQGKPKINWRSINNPDSHGKGNSRNNASIMNQIRSAITKGNTVYVRNIYTPKGKAPVEQLYRFSGLKEAQFQEYHRIRTGGAIDNVGMGVDEEFINDRARYYIDNQLEASVSKVDFEPSAHDHIVFTSRNPSNISNRPAALSNISTLERRVLKEGYFNREKRMTASEFRQEMKFPVGLSAAVIQANYEKYLEDYQKASRLNNQYPLSRIKDMSDEELMHLYQEGYKDEFGKQQPGIGYENKYAYARILNKVSKEIANRAALEQAALIRKNARAEVAANPNVDPEAAGVNFKINEQAEDLGVIQSWLMSSNIPSDHPALQTAIRKIKSEEKIFKREKSKYMQRINKVTGELYMDKFGFNPYSGMYGRAKSIIQNLSGKSASDELYGNLIKDEVVVDDSTGEEINNMRFHDENYLKSELAAGRLSQAEWNFYEEMKSITDEFKPYMNGGTRDQYIPHVAPTMGEAFARKGLLGVMVNTRTVDENLGDVKLMHNGELMYYKDIVAEMSKEMGNSNFQRKNSGKEAVQLYKLKAKATKLVRKGVNEDGSRISYSNITMGSTLGDVFMDEFTGERGISATHFPSRDLNKAFSDYVHGALFNSGNGVFTGYKKMLPLFDGIISRAYEKNHPNTVKYVEKVWRDYFLKGAKQHKTATPAELEALGLTTDNVVDFITRGSLFYWLGYKGLLIGGGVYAVGNILAGKYTSVRDRGGKKWITGEKRFWLGSGADSARLRDPLAGLKQSMRIMKKAGFMDINIYDDAPLSDSTKMGNFLGDIALMPMAWSEKWIQGVQFLGELTDAEYQGLAGDEDYQISPDRMSVIESNITLAQGRGYQPTDQRMIQMYSFGRMAMQFSRWIPTTIYNQFGSTDFDIYGKKYTGHYRAFGKAVMNVINGGMSPESYKKYRASLTESEKERLDSAFRGFGLMLLAAGGASMGFKHADKLLDDINIVADLDRMSNKVIPPAISMGMQLSGLK